jgi:hypothetical protein
MRFKLVCGRARNWGLGAAMWWEKRHGFKPEWDQVCRWLRNASMNAGRSHSVIGDDCVTFSDWLALSVALDGGTFADYYGEPSMPSARGGVPAYACLGYNYDREKKIRWHAIHEAGSSEVELAVLFGGVALSTD